MLRTEVQVVKAAFAINPSTHSAGISHRKLKSDYPLVAPNYAAQRSDMAKSLGLGRKVGAKAAAKKAATKRASKKSAAAA